MMVIETDTPGLCLLQNPDDLLFRKPLALHLVRPREGRSPIATGGNYSWQVTTQADDGANDGAYVCPFQYLALQFWLAAKKSA
jgi:hypothetical protein